MRCRKCSTEKKLQLPVLKGPYEPKITLIALVSASNFYNPDYIFPVKINYSSPSKLVEHPLKETKLTV